MQYGMASKIQRIVHHLGDEKPYISEHHVGPIGQVVKKK
jgi:hypothetical protein